MEKFFFTKKQKTLMKLHKDYYLNEDTLSSDSELDQKKLAETLMGFDFREPLNKKIWY
jgi:hypothetical protein